jgi:hypothetical protein
MSRSEEAGRLFHLVAFRDKPFPEQTQGTAANSFEFCCLHSHLNMLVSYCVALARLFFEMDNRGSVRSFAAKSTAGFRAAAPPGRGELR